MSIDVTITGGTAPDVTVGDAGASVSVPSVTGVLSLNGLSGAVTLAVVGGTLATAGNTLTVTVTGGGGGASSWTDLTGKPFTTLGTGLSVSVAGVLSATGLAIADTTGLQAALDAKAPLASPTFTGTVSGVTKAMVGLGSVDNVADASKPVSTAQAAADAVVQAYAIQRANHTGTQAVGTITGLGGAATLSVGTAAGTVAAGDDSRITGALSTATAATTYQPLDADLTSIAALTTATFGRSLLTQADASAARTTIGLGSLATQSGTFSGTSSGTNTGDQTFTITGDVTGSGTGSFAATLSASGVTAGTYASVTVDAKGRVTAGTATQAWSTITSTPTTLTGYGITDAATSTHTHGNITNAGAIGSTSGLPIITTTSGVLTVGAFGTSAGSFCQGNDSRLSDSRTPTTHASTHQTGGTDAVASVVVSPTSLAADTNDWAIGTGDVFRVAGTAARNITGIAAGTSGLAILLLNVGSFALTLKHQSASSTAANRFTVPWAGDCVLPASGGAVVILYDATSSTWRIV
jgi:hypothetical protein